jgi:hypothetical protein
MERKELVERVFESKPHGVKEPSGGSRRVAFFITPPNVLCGRQQFAGLHDTELSYSSSWRSRFLAFLVNLT